MHVRASQPAAVGCPPLLVLYGCWLTVDYSCLWYMQANHVGWARLSLLSCRLDRGWSADCIARSLIGGHHSGVGSG